jgi:hypothetical protein
MKIANFFAASASASLAFAPVAASLGALALMGAAAPAHAATYWTCEPGFVFQVDNNTAARCYKAQDTDYTAPIPCPRINTPLGPLGAALREDVVGKNDACATNVAGNIITGPLACNLGWTLEIREGADRCKRTTPSETRQPNRTVSR